MFAEFFSNSKKVLNSKWLILLKLHPHKLSAMAGAVKSSRKTRRKLGRSSFGATALNDLWKTRIQATNNRQILNVLHRSRLDLEREGSRLSDCSFAVQKCTNPLSCCRVYAVKYWFNVLRPKVQLSKSLLIWIKVHTNS